MLTVPDGFSIDSFAPTAGWKREIQATGSGEDAVIQKVTWTAAGIEPDAACRPARTRSSSSWPSPRTRKTYTFQVEQTYSDGSVVDWSGPESSDTPAPTVEAVSSLGGGGGDSSSTLAIVALVVGAIGVVLGGVALVARERPGARLRLRVVSSHSPRPSSPRAAGRGERARLSRPHVPSASGISRELAAAT